MFSFLKNLLGNRNKNEVSSSEIKPALPEHVQSSNNGELLIPYYPTQLVVGTAQSIGKLRDHNEDALFALNSVAAIGETQTPFGLFIIADGMGGHLNGEKASGSAARSFADHLIRNYYSFVMKFDSRSNMESMQEIIEHAVSEAQNAVIKKAPGGGTTLTAALIVGDQVTLAHIGDSRGYIINEKGELQLLTKDHTLVQRLIDLGQLTDEQARRFPQKNVVYRALGQLEPFTPDIHTQQIPHPGFLMICSDGLWGSVSDEEMSLIIRKNPDPSLACHRLVEAANRSGGPDNISVILIKTLS